MRNAYNIFVGNLQEVRPLGKPRRLLERNIRIYFGEIAYDWIYLAKDRDYWRVL
jgi:hypothetical protein